MTAEPNRDWGQLVCLGRNYAAHAAEMKAPAEPVLFFKAPGSLLFEPDPIELPSWSQNVHHEVELVVEMGAVARAVEPHRARALVRGYRIGIDLTARDVQARAKEKGRPWALAKGFDGAAPLSRLWTPDRCRESIDDTAIWLTVDGEERQRGRTSQMLMSIDQTISWISQHMTLRPGDLVFTGTPAGVGPVRSGEVIEAGIDALGTMRFEVR